MVVLEAVVYYFRIDMKNLRLIFLLIIATCPGLLLSSGSEESIKTRLTIMIIVDQCGYQFIRKLKPYFTGGIQQLLDNGVVYENAYHPHGLPATAVGFTAFNTGTVASYHGMTNNSWFSKDGKEILCDDDTPDNAAVFSRDGLYTYGKSAKNIMVDGLSDQVMLDRQPSNENYVFGISNKSRAAICLANKLGKAIWFDPVAGQFTSSKAYFNKLPEWLVNFNNTLGINRLESITWAKLCPSTHPAYHLKDATNYTYSKYKKGLIDNPIKIGPRYYQKDPYDIWNKTPYANKSVLDLARACITHYAPQTSGKLVILLGLSALDLVSHRQGPDSIETTDLLLRLDQQLQDFFADIEQIFPPEQTLYVFSADHGVDPIPELMVERGMPAGRINADSFVDTINQAINKKYGIAKSVWSLHCPNLYLNEPVLQKLSAETKNALLRDIVTVVKKQPGVANAWTYDDLMNTYYEPYQFECWYKNQLYPGRSGKIIFQPLPYYQFVKKNVGTTHETPYEFNTHVPLIFYQKNRFKSHVVLDKVWTLQVANTLAHLIDVPKPSTSTAALLSGLF